MSRSYKKNPVNKYAPCGNWGQKQANRRVRRFKGELSDGCEYKRLYNPWDIHDCVTRYTLDDALDFRSRMISASYAYRWGYNPDYDKEYYNIHECIKKWKKEYFWK